MTPREDQNEAEGGWTIDSWVDEPISNDTAVLSMVHTALRACPRV